MQRLTSHLDIPPTLLTLLGIENPPEDYSLGFDLFGEKKRSYTVATFLDKICYIDTDHKALFSMQKSLLLPKVTTRDDRQIYDREAFLASHRALLSRLLDDVVHVVELEF